MKTLFRKELRENLKLAVPACLLLTALADLWARGGGNGLVDRGCLLSASILLSLFGVALGWFQIQNEKPRDLWAFRDTLLRLSNGRWSCRSPLSSCWASFGTSQGC